MRVKSNVKAGTGSDSGTKTGPGEGGLWDL